MKKVISFIISTIMILAMAYSAIAAAPAVVSKTGIVKGFTEASVTLGIDGVNTIYKIEKDTKVTLSTIPTPIMEAAKKGVKANIKLSGTKLLEIDFGEIGEQQQGAMELTTTYTRVMTSDTNTEVTFANSKKEEAGEEEDNVFGYDPSERNKVTIGSVAVIPETLKVVLNGKELKVVKEDGKLDSTTKGDEVQIVKDSDDNDRLYLQFEVDLTEDATLVQEDIEKILTVTYKKKIFKITTNEIFKYCVDENVYVEVNGKESTLPKALNRSTYAYLVLSPLGNIIYIDSFYKDLQCTVKSISGDTLNISVAAKGRTPFTDTLKISEALTVQAEKGDALSLSDIKAGDTILVTVDPYENYKVIDIIKK